MSLLKKVKINNFIRIAEEGLDLSSLYLLSLCLDEYNVKGFTNVKIQGWVSGLMRKGLITEEGKITVEGRAALLILDEDFGRNTLKKITTERDEKFIEWWQAYPSINGFSYGGRQFPGIRKMRIQQKECEVLFYKLINEEGFTAEDIINGTLNHIALAKKLSYSSRENKLTYIPASTRYLREKIFADYITKEDTEQKELLTKDFEI